MVDLEEYTSFLLGFIYKFAVITTRVVTCHLNQKPWLEVRALLKACDTVFRAGEASVVREGRKGLTADTKIQCRLTSNDPNHMWKGIKYLWTTTPWCAMSKVPLPAKCTQPFPCHHPVTCPKVLPQQML